MNSITEITIWTSSKFRTVLTALLVGVAFYFGAALGLSLSTPPDYIAAFWPPNTFVLAALLLTDRRRWWIYFLAMTPAYLYASTFWQ
jgi:integral membrane sensor domain MASE1